MIKTRSPRGHTITGITGAERFTHSRILQHWLSRKYINPKLMFNICGHTLIPALVLICAHDSKSRVYATLGSKWLRRLFINVAAVDALL